MTHSIFASLKQALTPRWCPVGFVENGWMANQISEIKDESGKVAGRGGFRSVLTEKFEIIGY